MLWGKFSVILQPGLSGMILKIRRLYLSIPLIIYFADVSGSITTTVSQQGRMLPDKSAPEYADLMVV